MTISCESVRQNFAANPEKMRRLISFTLDSLSKSSKNTSISPFSSPIFTKTLTSLAGKNPNQLLRPPLYNAYATPRFFSNSFNAWRFQSAYKRSGWKIVGIFSNAATKITSNTPFAIYGRRSLSAWSYRLRSMWRSLMPNPEETVFVLIGINIVILLSWRTIDPVAMRRNFTVSMENFKSGRIHTLLTSAFSHIDTTHLLQNMMGLYFFGSYMSNMFGPQFLLKLYVAGGIAGSIFFLVHDAFFRSSSKDTFTQRPYALGASGAVNAIILLHIFLFPRATHYINLVIPVPAALSGAILIGTDLFRIMQRDSHISGAAHLGGAVVAALVWARMRKRWI